MKTCSKSFSVVIPTVVISKVAMIYFHSACSLSNSHFSYVDVSNHYRNSLRFRVDSPDLSSANAALSCLAHLRKTLIENGFCRRRWHFGCILDSVDFR